MDFTEFDPSSDTNGGNDQFYSNFAIEREDEQEQESKKEEEENQVEEMVPFETFDPTKGKWSNWVKRLEVTFDLFKVADEENRKKTLLYHMGMAAFEVLGQIAAPAEPADLDYEEIVQRLKDHYDPDEAPAPTEARLCWQFWQRRQMPGEKVTELMTALKELAAPCNFTCDSCNNQDRIIRNQFICGLRDPRIRQALLQEPELTTERALDIAEKMEEIGGEIPESFNEVSPWNVCDFTGSSSDFKRKKLDYSVKVEVDEEVAAAIQRNCDSCKNPKMKNAGDWHLVRLRAYRVTDWEKAMDALQQHGCTGLDASKQSFNFRLWAEFSQNIGKLDQLEALTLPETPADVINSIFTSNLTLRCLKADIKGTLKFEGIQNLEKLEELKLKTQNWHVLTNDLKPLGMLSNLKFLSITCVKGLGKANPEVIMHLTNLSILELGDCSDIPESFFFNQLPKLTQCNRLRLVGATDQSNTTAIVKAVGTKMPWLRQLDLVNFEVKHGFFEALSMCSRLQSLLLTPIYSQDAAITVNTVVRSVCNLYRSLHVFTWVITTELMQAADHLASRALQLVPSVVTEEYIPRLSIPIMEPTFDPYIQRQRDTIHLRSVSDFERVLRHSMPATYTRILQSNADEAWKVNLSQPNPNQVNAPPQPPNQRSLLSKPMRRKRNSNIRY